MYPTTIIKKWNLIYEGEYTVVYGMVWNSKEKGEMLELNYSLKNNKKWNKLLHIHTYTHTCAWTHTHTCLGTNTWLPHHTQPPPKWEYRVVKISTE